VADSANDRNSLRLDVSLALSATTDYPGPSSTNAFIPCYSSRPYTLRRNAIPSRSAAMKRRRASKTAVGCVQELLFIQILLTPSSLSRR